MVPIFFSTRWSLPLFVAGGLALGHFVGRWTKPTQPPAVAAADCSRRHVIDIPLDSRLLEDFLVSPHWTRQVRIVPSISDGKPLGFKIYAIRRGSLAWHLGLRNGDLIRTVNGYDLSSPDKCLEAYARLRASDLVVVELERAGISHELRYQIYR